MRTILMSFSSDVYEKLVDGRKIYEHRKHLPNEDIIAYLYVGAPVKAIKGILLLKNRVEIKEWKEKYSSDEAAIKRIEEYLKCNRYAMEIIEFQDTYDIPLEKLRNELPRFIVPRMYYYIDNTELFNYIKKNIVCKGDAIKHNFDSIKSNQICI